MQNTIKSKPKNKLKQFIATLVIFMMTFASVNFGVFTNSVFADDKGPLDRVNKAIGNISEEMLKGEIGDWHALDLNKAGYPIPEQAKERIKNDIINGAEKYSDTDCERMTLAALAAGLNPECILKNKDDQNGINLVEKIYNSDNMAMANAKVFGLIALNAGDFKIPEKAKWNKDNLIKGILDCRTTDNGWTFWGSKADADMTGMALSALAPYKNRAEVKDAIDKAVEQLSKMQSGKGGFVSWGSENCNSAAMAIVGLCDVGVNPAKDSRFIKNGTSLVDALLAYLVQGDSGFTFQPGNTDINGMATEQGLRALVSYRNLVENQGSVYNFKSNSQKETNEITLTVVGPKGTLVDNEKITLKSEDTLQTILKNTLENKGSILDIQDGKISIDNIINDSRIGYCWLVLVNGQEIDRITTKISSGNKVEVIYVLQEDGETLYRDVDSIVLDKNLLELQVNESVKLNGKVFPQNATNQKISWATNNEAVATVDENGNVKATGDGEAIITAYTEGNGEGKVEATCKVTVGTAIKGNTASLSIMGYKGQILNIKDAKVVDGENVEQFFQRVCNENNVKYVDKGGYIASIDGQGEFDRGVYSGWKYRVNGVFPNVGVSGVKVQNKDQIDFVYVASYMDTEAYRDAESIELNKTSLQLNAGEKAQLVATVLPNEATNKVALWKSSDESIAKVDANGNITAIKAGNVTITAYNQVAGEEPLKEAVCNITVK